MIRKLITGGSKQETDVVHLYVNEEQQNLKPERFTAEIHRAREGGGAPDVEGHSGDG